MMAMLAQAGHDCAALGTGWFEQTRSGSIRDHHAGLGVPVRRSDGARPRAIAHYRLQNIPVTVVETLHPIAESHDPDGMRQFAIVVRDTLQAWRPDVVVAYGHHPVVPAAMRAARDQGARTIYTIHAWGFDDPALFRHADRVLVTGQFTAARYRETAGIEATPLPAAIHWQDVMAPDGPRDFLTFINATLHKGLAPFARLADMLGQSRPDIPILVVESGNYAGALGATQGIDLTRHGNIAVSPAIDDPREIYALSRVVLVPSVFNETFGRVAAEAMINGIPPIASDRGALPETVADGGIVLPLPDWLTPAEMRIPSAAEMRPWYDAVVRLWDDTAHYRRCADAARQTARRLYSESVVKAQYAAYFEAPPPYPPVFSDPAAGQGGRPTGAGRG